jgi:streptogramin lyase
VFDADGQYLECVGGPLATSKTAHLAPVSKAALPSSLIGKFDRPHMVICRADGSLLVADTWNNRLQHFSPQGHAMIWPESSPKMPCPVAVDEDAIGRVLVTCWDSSQVLLFQKNGCEVPFYGMPELNKPYDARFYRNGMVVADSHNGRVLIFDQLPTAN